MQAPAIAAQKAVSTPNDFQKRMMCAEVDMTDQGKGRQAGTT
jgi:hypothetical protein